MEVDDRLEQTQKYQHTVSNKDLHTTSQRSILPDIAARAVQGYNSIKSSMERGSFEVRGAPSLQDSYDSNIYEFMTKVKDPTWKNNSNGIQGIFSGGGSSSILELNGKYYL